MKKLFTTCRLYALAILAILNARLFNYMVKQVDRHVVYLEHLKETELRADTLTKAKHNVPFSKKYTELLGKRQHIRTRSE